MEWLNSPINISLHLPICVLLRYSVFSPCDFILSKNHFIPPHIYHFPPLSTTLFLFYPILEKVSTILPDLQKFFLIFFVFFFQIQDIVHLTNKLVHIPRRGLYRKVRKTFLNAKMDQHTIHVPVHFCTDYPYFYFFFTVIVLLFVVPVESFTVIVTL